MRERERERERDTYRFVISRYVTAKEPPTKDWDDPRTQTPLAATSADDPFVSIHT